MVNLTPSGRMIVVFFGCVLAIVAALRGSWIEREPIQGQYRQGFFEQDTDSGEVVLTLDEQREDRFFPNMTFNYRRTIDIPPGTSVGITMSGGARYAVTGGEAGWLPYVVLGRAVKPAQPSVVSDDPDEEETLAERLTEALRLDVRDGALVLSPWDPSLPYRVDHERLRTLTQACAAPNTTTILEVDVAADRIAIRFGSCSLQAPLFPTVDDGRWRMALIGGTQWLSVERRDGGFRTDDTVDASRVAGWALCSALLTAALAFAFGMSTPVLISALLVTASLFVHPLLCVVFVVLAGALALLVAPVAIARALIPPRLRIVRALATVSAYLLAASWIVHMGSEAGRQSDLLRGRSVGDLIDTVGDRPSCALVGYSTVNDVQLRPATRGSWRYLADRCEACRSGVARFGQSGGTFALIREFACSSEAPLDDGTRLIFLGGSNDDVMLGTDYLLLAGRAGVLQAAAAVYETVARGLYYLGNPSASRLRTLMGDAAARSVSVLDSQRELIDATIDCAHRRGVGLWYFHDFLILDLLSGRDEARQRMLEARAATVTGAGDHFVNLLELFGDEAGVSWFNDYVHLSTIGHRRVSERICEEISR